VIDVSSTYMRMNNVTEDVNFVKSEGSLLVEETKRLESVT